MKDLKGVKILKTRKKTAKPPIPDINT